MLRFQCSGPMSESKPNANRRIAIRPKLRRNLCSMPARAVLWSKLDLLRLLGCYGTAKGSFRNLARPEQAYFPGFL